MGLRLTLLRWALLGLLRVLTLSAWLSRTLPWRLPFPRRLRDLEASQAWVVARLRDAGAIPADATITRFAVSRMEADKAFRSDLARIEIDYAHATRQHRHTCVAKLAPSGGSLRNHAVYLLQENHSKEVGFYQHLAAAVAPLAPHPYFAQVSRGSGHHCLLLSWLDAVQVTEQEGCTLEQAMLVMETLARLHAKHWAITPQRERWLAVIPNDAIDAMCATFEGPHRRMLSQLVANSWRHNQRPPQTIIHGDARVGNMLFARDGRSVHILDWQAVRRGKGVFDVIYFLSVSVPTAVRLQHETALLEHYRTALLAAGVPAYDPIDFDYDYMHAGILLFGMLSLPFLLAEASPDAANASSIAGVQDVWFERLFAMVDRIDYARWATQCPGTDATALHQAIRHVAQQKRRPGARPTPPLPPSASRA
jgi:hypothetical protein